MSKNFQKSTKVELESLPIVHRKAAGIDIGSRFHVVAVPADLVKDSVRTFDSFTNDLREMAEWLSSLGIKTVERQSYKKCSWAKDGH